MATVSVSEAQARAMRANPVEFDRVVDSLKIVDELFPVNFSGTVRCEKGCCTQVAPARGEAGRIMFLDRPGHTPECRERDENQNLACADYRTYVEINLRDPVTGEMKYQSMSCIGLPSDPFLWAETKREQWSQEGKNRPVLTDGHAREWTDREEEWFTAEAERQSKPRPWD